MRKRMISVLCILTCLTFIAAAGAAVAVYKKTARKAAGDASAESGAVQEPEGGAHPEAEPGTALKGRQPEQQADSKGQHAGQELEPENSSTGQTGSAASGQAGSTASSQTGNAASGQADDSEQAIQEMIRQMTLEDKLAQLFVLTPEALTGTGPVTKAGKRTQEALDRYPVGGIAYFSQNILSEEQFASMVRNIQQYSVERTGIPLFICVDEEGGSVARIAGRGFADVPEIPDMSRIGAAGDASAAYEIGRQIGGYLNRFQVNVDFAPVADVYSNAENTVVRKRSFGSDPEAAADMVENEVRGLRSRKVAAVLKHFPGHGDTAQDSHSQAAYSYKTMDEMRACEWIPFQAGIDARADFVMAGHISCPRACGDDTPASLSYTMLTEILRDEMGFQGIIITDALNMKAVTSRYSSAEAAVQAVQAGVDMLLAPQDFPSAYDALLHAVKLGDIKESRIDASIARIFKVKKVYQ